LRHVLDAVELAHGDDAFGQVLGAPRDRGLHFAELAGADAVREKLAHLRMRRWVDVDQRAVPGPVDDGIQADALRGRPGLPVAEHGAHALVAADEPHFVAAEPDSRRLVAQRAVMRVGVEQDLVGEKIEVAFGAGAVVHGAVSVLVWESPR